MWNNRAIQVIILQSSGNGVLWKFWLDSRLPRNSKPKWISKWLPLDRGYFEFYFRKRRRFTNNPGTYEFFFYLSICRNSLGLVGVVMQLILVKMSCISVLLINNLSKRGNMEILVRSSISPSPQVKMKLNLTVSR